MGFKSKFLFSILFIFCLSVLLIPSQVLGENKINELHCKIANSVQSKKEINRKDLKKNNSYSTAKNKNNISHSTNTDFSGQYEPRPIPLQFIAGLVVFVGGPIGLILLFISLIFSLVHKLKYRVNKVPKKTITIGGSLIVISLLSFLWLVYKANGF